MTGVQTCALPICLLNDVTPNIDQMPVLHTAGAGAFAVATGQTTVKVQLGFPSRLSTLEHLFDQVDAATGAVEFIAQQLIGGTGRGTKTTMHAFAQNGFGLLAFGGALVLGGKLGLHVRGPAPLGRVEKGGPCGTRHADQTGLAGDARWLAGQRWADSETRIQNRPGHGLG